MIDQAFLHLPGIGPERRAILHRCGLRNWRQIADSAEDIPRMGAAAWERVRAAARRSADALQQDDLRALVSELRKEDHWRLLGNYMEQAAFFDIETTGLSVDSEVTVVVCRQRGRLHTFVQGRNLDAFLDLLEEVDLLVSFNGSSFDVPRIERLFNIPAIPCPHIDLRWLCYHQQLSGGLKRIERELGVWRPSDVRNVDGAMAEILWRRWQMCKDRRALDCLIRYCCADVQALTVVAAELVSRNGIPAAIPDPEALWRELEDVSPRPRPADKAHPVPPADWTAPQAADSAQPASPCPEGSASRREALKRRLQTRLRRARGTPPYGG